MIPSRALLRFLSIFCFADSFTRPSYQAADIEVGASCSLADAITAANYGRATSAAARQADGADTITLVRSMSRSTPSCPGIHI